MGPSSDQPKINPWVLHRLSHVDGDWMGMISELLHFFGVLSPFADEKPEL